MKPDLEAAIQFATNAHAGQRDKQGQPYILHPLRVMLSIPEYLRIPALFHDIIEDTSVTESKLYQLGFLERDIELVLILTKRKGETRGEYIDRIMADPDAILIKRADIKDNMSRIETVEDAETRDRLERKYQRDLQQMNGP